MQNVLLIGGAGYIGSHIVFKLCDLGYNVKVLDDLSSGFKENIDTRAKFIHGSIFNDNISLISLKKALLTGDFSNNFT